MDDHLKDREGFITFLLERDLREINKKSPLKQLSV